ncbi:MAG: GNAT family N-acetyltransferase [Ruminococcus sp.]|nr:GNAT family N-acetyltransferase [Ruminococcus sp.]
MNKKYTIEIYTKDIKNNLSSGFDCGNDALTAFLKSYDALDDMFGKTYVMISDDRIIGYYNISTSCIENDKGIRIGGSVYINCLAVDKHYQKVKRGEYYISDILLADCLNRIENIRENTLGFAFVTLSSTDEGYYLYERNGFSPLEEDMKIAKNYGELSCVPMYLPIDYE